MSASAYLQAKINESRPVDANEECLPKRAICCVLNTDRKLGVCSAQVSVAEERMRFVARLLEGEMMAVCWNATA